MDSTVLVAEDDPSTRRLLELSLKSWGYQVVVATDGTEALAVLMQPEAPRIAILDWMMPGMDGVDICRHLRSLPDAQYRYIMLLTAKTQQDDLLEAFEAGADDYMTKPFHPKELKARLTAGVRGRSAPESVRQSGGPPSRARPSDHASSTSHKCGSGRRRSWRSAGNGVLRATSERHAAAAPKRKESQDFKGRVIAGRYRVEEQIGKGGMGSVWKAVHTQVGSTVAIKFLKRELAEDPASLARFNAEARLTAKLRSPHAVQVLDFGVTEDRLAYLVLEYLDGQTLWDAVHRYGPMPVEFVASLVTQAASALERAHALGIVHRDVKPDNILLIEDPEADEVSCPFRAKLIDFGLAKSSRPEEKLPGIPTPPRTRAGMLVGTPNFMTPEYLTENDTEVGPSGDLWALALTAYTAMTGKMPFDGSSLAQVVFSVCVRPRPVPSEVVPGIPPSVDAWFAKATAKAPTDRFQTPRELADAFQRAVDAMTSSRTPRVG